MNLELISSGNPTKISRDRALSYNLLRRERFKRSNKSLDRLNLIPNFIDQFIMNDQEKSSFASDLPSFHGIQNANPSLHSLNFQLKKNKCQILDILNDVCYEKCNKSEYKSICSYGSYGDSFKNNKKLFQIPNEPIKILDTPGVDDNYYTNILDWSSQNFICISLSNIGYLFDYSSMDFEQIYEAEEDENITSTVFNREGDKVAIGNDFGEILIFDIQTQKCITTMKNHDSRVGCLDWNEKGLISGSKKGSIVLHDLNSPNFCANSFNWHKQEIVGLKWNPVNDSFASGGNDNQALVWSILKDEPLIKQKHNAAVRALAWSHKTPWLLATGGGYSDKTIYTFNTDNNTLVDARETDGQVCSIIFSRITNDLISCHGLPTNDISVWRTNGLKRVIQLTGHELRPLHACLNPDSTVLISVSADETMRFWKLFDCEKNPQNQKLVSLTKGSKASFKMNNSNNENNIEPSDGIEYEDYDYGFEYENDYGNDSCKNSETFK